MSNRRSRPVRQWLNQISAKAEVSWFLQYSIAGAAVLLALVFMVLIDPWIPMQGSPFLIFFAAIMASAWYGGFGPGIFATLLAGLAASYFFLPPQYTFTVASVLDLLRLGLFGVVSLFISLLSAARRQLIEDVQRERDFVAAIVNTAGSLIVVLDQHGRIVQFNRACERVTGYFRDEVVGRYIWDLCIPSDEIAPVKQVFQKLLAEHVPGEYEGNWITRDGATRVIAWSNSVLLERGAVRYVIGTGIDITERKQAEITLQQANETLQALIQASPLSITVLDRSGRVKLWNPAAERIFGWRAEEVLERVLPTVPDSRQEEFQANLEKTLNGAIVDGIEVSRQRKDGSTLYASLWTAILRGSAHPTKGAALQRNGDSVLSIMADLSDRKQAEAALKDSQERLAKLFDANVIGLLFGDVDGGIHQANDEFLRMIGYSREELQSGQINWLTITPPEYLPLDAERIAEAKKRGACTPYEKAYICKDGSQIPVLIGYALLGEAMQQSVAFILDLTERKRLEQVLRHQAQELAQANRMKDEFLAVLSHELRTPLNSILGWSQLLKNRRLDPETKARALETIERNARLQTQLIEDILDVAKTIRGKMRLQLRPVELTPVIAAAIDAMQPAATAKRIRLEFRPPLSVSQVNGDPDRLQQVIWNVISNAIKFTPEGGRVQIRLIEPEPTNSNLASSDVRIQVTDTGKGISPECLPFVFDRFWQVDSSTARPSGGLGLGLAIVRHIIELHGGSVQAESPGLGQGSTFTISLPRLKPAQVTGLPNTEIEHENDKPLPDAAGSGEDVGVHYEAST